jgi:hypothetical protein
MFKNNLILRNVVAMAICLIGMTIFSGCDPDEDKDENALKQMTMTTANTVVRLQLRGTGNFSFDWGDDSSIETGTFGVDIDADEEGWYEFSFNYSNETLRTITITGDNIYALEIPAIQLLTLDVSNNPSLSSLYCSSNQLTVLNIGRLANLDYLSCGYNQLTSLDLSQLVNLTYLSCGPNQITSLDLEDLVKLDFLWCSDNLLSSLDVDNLTNLELLNCSYNQLTSLNLSRLTKLESLNCSNNTLTSLNLSGLVEIKELWCGYNSLSSLNVSGLNNLGYLECQNNYMNATALNDFFTSLPVAKFFGLLPIHIQDNGPNYDGTGALNCDITMAEDKGWNVYR